MRRTTPLVLGLALLFLTAAGCKKGPPEIVPAEGVVLLDGKPLPKAYVEFIPELEGYGAEMNSHALTDDEGKFQLQNVWKQQPGAAVGKHRVLVSEDAVPPDMRSPDARTQARLMQYYASLKNRPIPDKYGNFSTTPLRIEVKKEQQSYEVTLAR